MLQSNDSESSPLSDSVVVEEKSCESAKGPEPRKETVRPFESHVAQGSSNLESSVMLNVPILEAGTTNEETQGQLAQLSDVIQAPMNCTVGLHEWLVQPRS
jgi:hypothetical protein